MDERYTNGNYFWAGIKNDKIDKCGVNTKAFINALLEDKYSVYEFDYIVIYDNKKDAMDFLKTEEKRIANAEKDKILNVRIDWR